MEEKKTELDGMVVPEKVYQPDVVVTTWFKTWALQCGSCRKDFVKFSFFRKPRCPYCKTINRPQFHVLPY